MSSTSTSRLYKHTIVTLIFLVTTRLVRPCQTFSLSHATSYQPFSATLNTFLETRSVANSLSFLFLCSECARHFYMYYMSYMPSARASIVCRNSKLNMIVELRNFKLLHEAFSNYHKTADGIRGETVALCGLCIRLACRALTKSLYSVRAAPSRGPPRSNIQIPLLAYAVSHTFGTFAHPLWSVITTRQNGISFDFTLDHLTYDTLA
ncbi:hypothetical protein BKA82DRAFT_2786716 [Pisolithus tinctorius]|nr:hypothetical protein BKA82DRAFT_2786716 [Pisolithus tinctorius]